MEVLTWAMSLEDVQPSTKLLAIYVAGLYGMCETVRIDGAKACKKCCINYSRPAFENMLNGVPGLKWERETAGIYRLELYHIVAEAVGDES